MRHYPRQSVRITTALNPAAAPIDGPFRLGCVQVRGGQQAFDAERHLAPTALNDRHGCVAVTHSRVNASGQNAHARPSHTGTRAGDGRQCGPARSTLRPRRSARSFRPRSQGTPRKWRWWRHRRGRRGRQPTETPCADWPARWRTIRRPHAVADYPTGQGRRLHERRSGVACAVRTSATSPRATSCSSANWRIVSNIENRVRPEDRSAISSDLRTSASSRSRTA